MCMYKCIYTHLKQSIFKISGEKSIAELALYVYTMCSHFAGVTCAVMSSVKVYVTNY